jgi:hypothetical protein
MAELRAAVASGHCPFSAVICEDINRAGRDMLDSLRLEKELRAAGVLIFATSEPIDVQAPQASTMLVRRMRMAESEYFRYNLKTNMWEGEQRIISLPREYWTWAAHENAHEALTDTDTWEKAQTTGRERGNRMDPGTRHLGRDSGRLYPYRSKIHCNQCHRRMHGTHAPPHSPASPWSTTCAPPG